LFTGKQYKIKVPTFSIKFLGDVQNQFKETMRQSTSHAFKLCKLHINNFHRQLIFLDLLEVSCILTV